MYTYARHLFFVLAFIPLTIIPYSCQRKNVCTRPLLSSTSSIIFVHLFTFIRSTLLSLKSIARSNPIKSNSAALHFCCPQSAVCRLPLEYKFRNYSSEHIIILTSIVMQRSVQSPTVTYRSLIIHSNSLICSPMRCSESNVDWS